MTTPETMDDTRREVAGAATATTATPATIVVNELAKLRHSRVGLVATGMILGVVALTLGSTVTSAEFSDPASRSWSVSLAGLSMAMPLLCPLLIAVLASRMVDMEHTGQGWLLNQTAGATPGTLCRAKWAVAAAIVTAATVVIHLVVWALGRLLGIDAPVPVALWVGFAAAGLVINLVILGLQVLLSAKVDNQLIPLGVAVLGTVVAVFAAGLPTWFAHATPWGYYSLGVAADYQDGRLVTLSPSYTSIAVMALLIATVFLLITRNFDRQEA